jgi:hypothetical protein
MSTSIFYRITGFCQIDRMNTEVQLFHPVYPADPEILSKTVRSQRTILVPLVPASAAAK